MGLLCSKQPSGFLFSSDNNENLSIMFIDQEVIMFFYNKAESKYFRLSKSLSKLFNSAVLVAGNQP